MRVILAATALAGLAACGGPGEGTYTTEDGETVEYDIDAGGGESTFTMETEDGEDIAVNFGSDVSVDLPRGFSVYPGATVVSSANVAVGEGTGSVVTMNSGDTAEDIIAFYKRQAEAAGVVIEGTMNSAAMSSLQGKSESGTDFSVTVFGGEGTSTIQLAVGDNFE